MKTTELRIGNYLQDREGHLCKVEGLAIEMQECRIYVVNGCVTAMPVKPIPITAELLIKIGFTKDPLVPFYNMPMPRNIGYISINPDNQVIWIKHHNTDSAINPGIIKYLHQVQNLYFAFTSEELINKLK